MSFLSQPILLEMFEQYLRVNQIGLNTEIYLVQLIIKRKTMLKKSIIGLSLSLSLFSFQKKQQCCGIIGIVSQKRQNVGELLNQGIELLKNRGYDSAGVVAFQNINGSISSKLIKHADNELKKYNCIQRVVKEVTKTIVNAKIGIGHTRWATCGEKTVRNAHPHYDNSESIYLVHNGIIGNYNELRNSHLKEVEFNSETDSEVLVQLLGKSKKQGKNMIESLKELSNQVGICEQWGLVVIDKDKPQTIYTSTNKSPILVGLGEDEIFVASQVIAFQKHVNEYFDTKDGEILQLSVKNIQNLRQRINNQGRMRKINKTIEVLVKPPEKFNSFYEYQIYQEGQIDFKPDFARVQALTFGDNLTLLGCGSSLYAAQSSRHIFRKLNCFKKINIFDPVELDQEEIVEDQTVVMISQSGQTSDLLKIVEKCKQKNGVKCIGIINMEGSSLARKVDFPIYLKVGRQVSVAATKSMFHQALNLIQLATQIAEQKQPKNMSIIRDIRNQLAQISSFVRLTIQNVQSKCQDLAKIIYSKQSLYLLAMKEGLAIAREAALKIKELNYIHAQALGACQMKHGPIALIESQKKNQTVVIMFILENQTFSQLKNALDQMYSRNAYVVVITDCQDKLEQINKQVEKNQSKQNYNFIINVPKLKHLSYLLTLIPIQILVNEISKLKNINPDMPRNLAKTVTV